MTHASIPAAARARVGLLDSLIRLSPGCEHHRDLVRDLLEGLASLDDVKQEAAVTAHA
jgi:cystathionine beta-lyase/cystathionine gamma-synthase